MDGKKFMLEVSSNGAAKLRETVKTKLSEFIGEDTDDVLVVRFLSHIEGCYCRLSDVCCRYFDVQTPVT